MSLQPFDRPSDPSSSPDKSRSQDQPRRQNIPLYKLILHAEGVNDMMFVVRTIMELTRLCRAEATHKMWEAHHLGRSQLLITHKERAELYVDQFASKSLAVAIEPV